MPWPADIDYQDAIQNPSHCFSDAALRAGKAEQAQDAELWMAGGAIASVFQIGSGGRRYAVRCFKEPVTNQQRRYQVIGDYLKRQKQDVFAAFEFQSNGVKVGGQWYPIVKMDWVNGETLDDFIKKNLRKPGILTGLRDEFRRLVQALRACGVAHGDLQHRNILVTPQRKMRVVDYDGMFVPPIRAVSKAAPELGHPNFQHPRRTPGDYDAETDNFSALVIYLSLWALAEQPGLWKEFHVENQNLIFLNKDFIQQNSTLMDRLVSTASPGVRKLTEILWTACRSPSASKVRNLEDALRDAPQTVAPLVPQADILVTDAGGQEINALTCTLAPNATSSQLAFYLRNDGQVAADVHVSAKEAWLRVDAGSVKLAPGIQHKISLTVSAAPGAADLTITTGDWWGASQAQTLHLKALRAPGQASLGPTTTSTSPPGSTTGPPPPPPPSPPPPSPRPDLSSAFVLIVIAAIIIGAIVVQKSRQEDHETAPTRSEQQTTLPTPPYCEREDAYQDALHPIGTQAIRNYIAACEPKDGSYVSPAKDQLDSRLYTQALACVQQSTSCDVSSCIQMLSGEFPGSSRLDYLRTQAASTRPASCSASQPETFEFSICNDSQESAWVAVAGRPSDGSNWIASGWWRIDPNNCQALGRYLKGNVYATGATAIAGRGWRGNTWICVDPGRFEHVVAANQACGADQHLEGFYQFAATDDYEWRLPPLPYASDGQPPPLMNQQPNQYRPHDFQLDGR
jgi:uncharacterized membrane protein